MIIFDDALDVFFRCLNVSCTYLSTKNSSIRIIAYESKIVNVFHALLNWVFHDHYWIYIRKTNTWNRNERSPWLTNSIVCQPMSIHENVRSIVKCIVISNIRCVYLSFCHSCNDLFLLIEHWCRACRQRWLISLSIRIGLRLSFFLS
jgi:hypothetical protein